MIWDTATWKEVARIRPHAGLTTLTLSPSGRIATAGADGTASVWTLDGKSIAQVGSGGEALNDAELSDDGSLLVTASPDRTATLWSVPDGRRLRVLRGHGEPVDPNETDPEQVAVRDTASAS